ncbi:type II toxin-antitoxin system HicB family antitoxin [Emticicia sp.]|uniref:type II toxin-antitoxin system HicB family antitoxin n=1 Tax=Emticicia sp. TaxID=1930953 RepID=UPI003751F366
MKLTATIQKSEDGWFVGQIKELPAVIEQGKSVEELKKNLSEALEFYLETQRLLFDKTHQNQFFLKEEEFAFA